MLPRSLDPARRRALLARISHTPQPELVAHVAADLATKGSNFGALRIHNELTLEQLHALADRVAELRTHRAWIDAVVRRMRPPSTVDLELDRAAREAYLVELWQFVEALPPAASSLKVHVLWHLLDAIRKRDASPDTALFTAYLKLPRPASYVARRWLDRIRPDEIAQLGADFRATTGLAVAGDDEALVRDLLHRKIDDAAKFAEWLDRSWLDAEIATANLLAGHDSDRATLALGPACAATLREQIDLSWCIHNPTRFAADEPIVLEANVKHVPELVVKVFRIDPLAYFQHHRREVGTDLDLDGLAASHELVMRFAEPPIRRLRRRIELPMCARPGTYVIDLIGNGMASRAVVHKGRLRHVMRSGAAGHVVTILDEAGRARADARAWIGDREYVPDERGAVVVPFSTAPGTTPMLLSCGDVATVDRVDLRRETYALAANLVVDRQALTAGRTARAILRARLSVAGAPASVALLNRTTWDVTLTDRQGVAVTKSQPLVLADDDATVLEWPLGDDTARVSVSVRATVKVISEQREQELVATIAPFEVATIHGTTGIEALYLAQTANGYVISALGKSGEPRARRPVTIGVVHRWARTQLNVELATDEQGRITLGQLHGAERLTATLGSVTQTWSIDDPAMPSSSHHVTHDAIVHISASRNARDVITRASLVELRGAAPMRHVTAKLEPLEGAIAVRGLPPGEYALRAPGMAPAMIRIAAPGTEIANTIVTAGELVELSRAVPAIAKLDSAVAIIGATSRTRVHVIATRFAAAHVEPLALGPVRDPSSRFDRARATTYVSGRELGDEYRYVLERRAAKRHPGLLLDKPSLLLHPWARRMTTTDVAAARLGGAFAPPAPASVAGGYGAARARGEPVAASTAAFVGYDFLPAAPVVIANLVPDASGNVAIPVAELGRATCVTVIVDDPAGVAVRRLALVEQPLEPRDLRLRVVLDPARHATQRKAIAPLQTSATLVIEDLATAKLHLVDSLERAHAYLLALRDDATLRELAFITRWHAIADAERRELYSKYACHELHLFLVHKDRAFFEAVVRPALACKRTKTFVDHWLLDADLAPYLEPAALARLNAVERALLARRLTAEPAIARILEDEVAIIPPDPTLDTRLIDALIGGATLDADSAIAAGQLEAFAAAEEMSETTSENAPMEMARSIAPSQQAPAPSRPRAAPMAKKAMLRDASRGDNFEIDMELREQAPAPMYRAADRTQEWAENNWWHLTPAQSGADMIAPNRLWRDLARHASGSFLSPWLGLAAGSFAEAMCALAVIDLPFVAGPHAIAADGPRLTIVAAGNALVGTSQLVDGELVTAGAPLVVGQSYVRADDRHRWVDGEQIDKYVDAFATAVVYTCQVVIANPTSSRQRVAALVQMPRGSIAVAGARPTHTIDVLLSPYGTYGHEYSFYFPAAGRHSHFPVHVTRAGAIVAAAPGAVLEVTAGGAAIDPQSWAHVSQHGSLADVVAFLQRANLAEIDLDRTAWRLKLRAAYDAIVGVLERRRGYHATTWSYALLHRDRARIRAWLRTLGERLLQAGPVLEMPIVEQDAEPLGGYEHLELAPLVNARAHRLGAKLRILNDGLAAQYQRFLELVAHRRAPSPRISSRPRHTYSRKIGSSRPSRRWRAFRSTGSQSACNTITSPRMPRASSASCHARAR